MIDHPQDFLAGTIVGIGLAICFVTTLVFLLGDKP